MAACAPTLIIPLYSSGPVHAAFPPLKDAVVVALKYKAPEIKEEQIEWIQDGKRILRRGDPLRIRVDGDPKLNRDLNVNPDGSLSFPHAGNLVAEGKSVENLLQRLDARLSVILRNPDVRILVAKRRDGTAAVVGMVRHPDEFRFRRPPWLLGAITRVGQYAHGANPAQVLVVRTTENKVIVCNLFYPGNRTQNIPIRDGDVIVVTGLYSEKLSYAPEWRPVAEFVSGRLDRNGLIRALKP